MIGENDKLIIPEWIKALSREELKEEKEKILKELEKQKLKEHSCNSEITPIE